jgi:hypothetical protein
MRSALTPLVLAWLAAHAALLAVFLTLKFLGAKFLLMAALLATALWFLMRRRTALLPAPPPSMV